MSEVWMGEGTGPRGILFHPNKRIAYINCELNGSMVVCEIKEDGLHKVQSIKCYPEDFKC